MLFYRKRIPITNRHNEVYILNLVKWSTKGNGFVYVLFNNIFYRPNATSTEDFQITFSGNASVYNGICDWVYEGRLLVSSYISHIHVDLDTSMKLYIIFTSFVI